MFGMTQYQTAFILFVLIFFSALAFIAVAQEIGRTRRSAHEATKAKAEALGRATKAVEGRE